MVKGTHAVTSFGRRDPAEAQAWLKASLDSKTAVAVTAHPAEMAVAPGEAVAEEAVPPSSAAAAAEESLPTVVVVAKEAIHPDHLQRHAELTAQIAALEGEKPSECLADALFVVSSLSHSHKEQVQALAPLPEQIQREHKKVGGLTPGACCLFLVPHASKKLATHEQALAKLEQELTKGQKALADANTQLGTATVAEAGWQAKVGQLELLSGERDALMAAIFDGPAWAQDATLQTLKAEYADLSGRAAEQQRDLKAFDHGTGKLQSASDKLAQAQELLAKTRFAGYLELGVADDSLAADATEMAIVSGAESAVARAVVDYSSAQADIPSLPTFVKGDILESARVGVFAVLFLGGGLFMDLLEVRLIHQCMEDLAGLQKGVAQALQYASAVAAGKHSSLAALRSAIDAKQADKHLYWNSQLLSAQE